MQQRNFIQIIVNFDIQQVISHNNCATYASVCAVCMHIRHKHHLIERNHVKAKHFDNNLNKFAFHLRPSLSFLHSLWNKWKRFCSHKLVSHFTKSSYSENTSSCMWTTRQIWHVHQRSKATLFIFEYLVPSYRLLSFKSLLNWAKILLSIRQHRKRYRLNHQHCVKFASSILKAFTFFIEIPSYLCLFCSILLFLVHLSHSLIYIGSHTSYFLLFWSKFMQKIMPLLRSIPHWKA